MASEITVEFHNGNVQISVDGVKGESCKDLTKQLEKALGTVTKDEPTKEMYEKEQKQKTDIRIRQ